MLLMTYVAEHACVPNEIKNLNLNVFNMITEIKASRTLTTHTLCKCECKCDCRLYNLNQKWNNNKSHCECKNPKDYFVFKNGYF